jgi:flagellar hook-length control protein FliK
MVMLKSSAFLNSFFMSSQSASQGKTLSSGLKSGGSTTAPGDNLFARLLAKTKPGAVFAVNSHAKPFFSTEVDTSVAVVRPKGKDNNSPIANILESAFLKHGVSPDNVVLSREDFDFLATVLEDMGFSRSSLKSFFQEINETRSDGLVTLSHFLKDLSGFEQTEALESNISISLTNSLDKSAVPHLELILRDLDMPSEKIDSLLSSVARKTGAIDIEKLVFQLKAYVDTKDKNSDASQVADKLPIAKDTKDAKRVQSDPPSVQRVTSGLEKLGLSVPNKASHLPFTLETLIQSLEKKIGETVSVPKNMPVDATRIAESVLEMPAVKSMAMEKTEAYFGFAREMMIDKQNRSAEKGQTAQNAESQNLFSVKKEGVIGGHPKADPLISPVDGQDDEMFHKSDIDRRPVKTGMLRQVFEKKGTDHKSQTESRPIPVEILKQETEKRAVVHKVTTEPSPISVDVSKIDGAVRQEIHQNLMPGGEKFQGVGISFANVAENVSAPVKQTAAFQQSPLPSAVVNQVGKEIASFLHRGDRIFTLQLKPPELGMVNIEMDVKENVLKMSVVTETSSAKDMLHANYVDLKRVLEGYGIRVETFDVQLNSNLNHASSNGDGSLNQQNSQSGTGKNRLFGEPSGETTEENTGEAPVSPQTMNEARLDLLA